MAIVTEKTEAAAGDPGHPHAGGAGELVPLDPDHPGFKDPVYRSRRNAIAKLALEYRDGDPLPRVEYTEDEQAVWRTVWEHLAPLHEQRRVPRVEGELRGARSRPPRGCRSSPM